MVAEWRERRIGNVKRSPAQLTDFRPASLRYLCDAYQTRDRLRPASNDDFGTRLDFIKDERQV